MLNILLPTTLACLISAQAIPENRSLDELLSKSTDILEKSMSKEEKAFLSHLPMSCTVQWLQIKKRQVFSGGEYDDLCNDNKFREYANKRFNIVHREEFFFAVVCVVYYHRLNEKDWNSAMCFDAAASITNVSRRKIPSKPPAEPKR